MIVIKTTKKIFNISQLPPIVYILLSPFIIVDAVITVFYLFIRFLLGYWKCEQCKRQCSIKDKKNKIFTYSDEYIYKCDGCFILDQITEGE